MKTLNYTDTMIICYDDNHCIAQIDFFELQIFVQVVESEVFAFVRATSPDGSGSITEGVTTADILSYLEGGGYVVPSESDIKMPEVTAVGLYPINIRGVRAILHVIEAVAIKQD